MQPSQGALTGLLKRVLFRESIKHPRLQRLWSRLHTIAIFGMNYGGGGLIESSGETWVLREVVARRCRQVAAPVVFDVGANVQQSERTLNVVATLNASNVGGSAGRTLTLRLNAKASVKSVAISGAAASFREEPKPKERDL